MSTLYGRTWHMILGSLEIRNLDVQFTATRNLKPEANVCSISVWNLNKSNRKSIEAQTSKDGVPVQLFAGYEDPGASMIFSGVLRQARSVRDGADIITTVESGDGTNKSNKVVAFSLAKGSTPEQAIRKIAEAMGVGTGNLGDLTAGRQFPSGNKTGHVGFFGGASAELTRVCRSVGLDWSIQNGNLQLLQLTRALEGQAIELTPETGLIDSPAVDNEGKLSAQALIIPGLDPGRVVVIEGENVKGNFRVESVTYAGETAGPAWYASIEGKAY